MTRILIVEDNEMNREILTRRLERRGYEVCLASDGQEAVNMATTMLPDVILMDLNLPVMDGWEATRLIKADERTSAIPILCITAHAMLDDRRRGIAAGCDDYETKPIEFERILDKITRFTRP
jgi:CheY-like chemotaxis protein